MADTAVMGFAEIVAGLEEEFDLGKRCEADGCGNEQKWKGSCEACGFNMKLCESCKQREEAAYLMVKLTNDPRCRRCAAPMVLVWELIEF